LDRQGVPWFVAPYPWRLPGAEESPQAYLADRMNRARDLAEYFRAARADIVVVNTAVIPEAVLAAALAGLPTVLHAHGLVSRALIEDLNTAAWRAAEDLSVTFADHVASPSAWTAEFFAFTHGLTADRTTVIPNVVAGLDDLEPTPPGEALVQLGTIESNKNQAMLLRALVRVKRDGRRLRASIIGDAVPAYRERLEHMIERYGLNGQVAIHKRTSDPDAVYRRSGIVVVTSRLESFSRVCVEAMAHGRPVVATRCGGPEGLIEDGRTGFLVDVDDHRALADRIERLLASPELRLRIGQAAREDAMARFSPAAVTPAYVELLERTLRTGGPRAPDWSTRQARALSLVGTGRTPVLRPPRPAPARRVKIKFPSNSSRGATALLPADGAAEALFTQMSAKIVGERKVRERLRPPPLGLLQIYRRRAGDLTPVIRDSWFAPWLQQGEPGDRIGLSDFIASGQSTTYVLRPEKDGFSGVDVAPWLLVGAWKPTDVVIGEILTADGARVLGAGMGVADPETGKDSLRLRFTPLTERPERVLLRLTGQTGADVLGLKLFERLRYEPLTRRMRKRDLLCNLLYDG